MRFTDSDMAKVGVDIVSKNPIRLRCMKCGVVWSPNIQPGGRLPRGYWHCPNGHNVPYRLDEPIKPEHIKAVNEAFEKPFEPKGE